MDKLIPVYIAIAVMTVIVILLMKNRSLPWSEMTQKQRQLRMILVITGFIFMITGLIAFLYLRSVEV